MFSTANKSDVVGHSNDGSGIDIEDIGLTKKTGLKPIVSSVTKRKRGIDDEFRDVDFSKSWQEVLGPPPPYGNTKVSAIKFLHSKLYEIYTDKYFNFCVFIFYVWE